MPTKNAFWLTYALIFILSLGALAYGVIARFNRHSLKPKRHWRPTHVCIPSA